MRFVTLRTLIALCLTGACSEAAALRIMDLASQPASPGILERVHGSVGQGFQGVPVAGGADCDGDGFEEVAIAAMLADPLGRTNAGEVRLVFGDGQIGGVVDTAGPPPNVLRIVGDANTETTGAEIWMDDVTGDGIGDLLICRQNYTPAPGLEGAGGLTILRGGPVLSALASSGIGIDLRSPPASVEHVTISGASQYDRLGIWARTGDIDGDELADIVVGSDQVDAPGEDNRGAVYVIRGGPHLLASSEVSMAEFGSTPLVGNVARFHPPAGSRRYHLGATCQIADLDGNGRAEVLAAATLNRSGAGIRPFSFPVSEYQSSGGAPDGRLYIAWDDNFPATPWPVSYEFVITQPPGSFTQIDGASFNVSFGEEIVGGLDFDGDSVPDLFVGDLAGDAASLIGQSRPTSGVGHLITNGAALRGLTFNVTSPPASVETTTFVGPRQGAISADTATLGDYNADGLGDLVIGNPNDSPVGRIQAGTMHVVFGQVGGWPSVVDLSPNGLAILTGVEIIEIRGAQGDIAGDQGDMICYSASLGDVDGDGIIDIVANEMQGNGLAPGTRDVGNLIVIGGAALAPRRNGLSVH